MINNIRFKIIAGKINKIPEFYTIFARYAARVLSTFFIFAVIDVSLVNTPLTGVINFVF